VDPVRINLTGFRSDTTEKRSDPDPPEPDHVFVFMRILDLIFFLIQMSEIFPLL
jgi:hypothetical protein